MKRTVKYWVDGQKLDYKHAKKMKDFNPNYYTVEYRETWKEKKYDVMHRLEVNLLFWSIEIGLFALAMFVLFHYCI